MLLEETSVKQFHQVRVESQLETTKEGSFIAA